MCTHLCVTYVHFVPTIDEKDWEKKPNKKSGKNGGKAGKKKKGAQEKQQGDEAGDDSGEGTGTDTDSSGDEHGDAGSAADPKDPTGPKFAVDYSRGEVLMESSGMSTMHTGHNAQWAVDTCKNVRACARVALNARTDGTSWGRISWGLILSGVA